jgi:hypothetical protein
MRHLAALRHRADHHPALQVGFFGLPRVGLIQHRDLRTRARAELQQLMPFAAAIDSPAKKVATVELNRTHETPQVPAGPRPPACRSPHWLKWN